jgi:hypothetical protein
VQAHSTLAFKEEHGPPVAAVADLGILATNWQQSPRTFSQGDFDYSGTVDVNDLGILASHWQQQLAPPNAPFAVISPKRPSSKRISVDLL